MKVFKGFEDLKAHLGQEIGITGWLTITQERIDGFAENTEDRFWIHTDPERAKTQSPFGSTIAHGLLTLSLLPRFTYSLYTVENIKLVVNYGFNKVRFISPVPVNSKLRMKAVLTDVQPEADGAIITTTCTFEVEGNPKPACVAESLSRVWL